MKFCVLASGSKGNMTYVETGNTRLLIDVGITFTNAQLRIPDVDLKNVTDILITHDHIDHCKNLVTILKRTNATLYLAKETYQALINKKYQINGFKVKFIQSDGRYKIGDLDVLTLELSHDCDMTFGFVFIDGDKQLGYVADTGFFPKRYKSLIGKLDALVIESNHNIEMLINSNRDQRLIKRILSVKGHLSNQSCYELLKDEVNEHNKYIVLAHVSEDCNCDECLYEEVINKLKLIYQGEILIARQHEALKMIEL